jgi:hypothetical protein
MRAIIIAIPRVGREIAFEVRQFQGFEDVLIVLVRFDRNARRALDSSKSLAMNNTFMRPRSDLLI